MNCDVDDLLPSFLPSLFTTSNINSLSAKQIGGLVAPFHLLPARRAAPAPACGFIFVTCVYDVDLGDGSLSQVECPDFGKLVGQGWDSALS